MQEKKYLTQNDVAKLKKACETSDDGIVISELSRTGMSVNEIKRAKGPIFEPRI